MANDLRKIDVEKHNRLVQSILIKLSGIAGLVSVKEPDWVPKKITSVKAEIKRLKLY